MRRQGRIITAAEMIADRHQVLPVKPVSIEQLARALMMARPSGLPKRVRAQWEIDVEHIGDLLAVNYPGFQRDRFLAMCLR